MVDSFLPDEIYFYDAWLNDWVFLLSFLVLGLEAIRYLLKKKLTWGMVEDSITNFVTFLCGSRNYYRHHRRTGCITAKMNNTSTKTTPAFS